MVEESGQHGCPIEHPTVRYERTDVSFAWILGILIAATILLAVALIALIGFFRSYRDYQARIKESSFPLAPTPSKPLPPQPRLEQVDRLAGVEGPQVYERPAATADLLNNYGTTSENGFIHIPIDRAMKLLENTLPVRQEPARSRNRMDGLIDSGESNSGRIFRGKPRWHED